MIGEITERGHSCPPFNQRVGKPALLFPAGLVTGSDFYDPRLLREDKSGVLGLRLSLCFENGDLRRKLLFAATERPEKKSNSRITVQSTQKRRCANFVAITRDLFGYGTYQVSRYLERVQSRA